MGCGPGCQGDLSVCEAHTVGISKCFGRPLAMPPLATCPAPQLEPQPGLLRASASTPASVALGSQSRPPPPPALPGPPFSPAAPHRPSISSHCSLCSSHHACQRLARITSTSGSFLLTRVPVLSLTWHFSECVP